MLNIDARNKSAITIWTLLSAPSQRQPRAKLDRSPSPKLRRISGSKKKRNSRRGS